MGLFELAAAVVYFALSLWHFRSREWFGCTCYFFLAVFAAGIFMSGGGFSEMETPQIASVVLHGDQSNHGKVG